MQERQMDLPVTLCPDMVREFERHLYRQERSANTIAKYVRDLRAFFAFLNGRECSRECLLEWKEQLTDTHVPSSVNSMLAAVNGFLDWTGLVWQDGR